MDLGWIAEWFNSVTGFFQASWDFINSGIYTFFKDALVVVTKALIWSYIEFKVMMLDVAYTVVMEILKETGVVELVKSAWSSVPGDIQSMLSFFKIPQGLTLIFAALPTRWAMKFIPGA